MNTNRPDNGTCCGRENLVLNPGCFATVQNPPVRSGLPHKELFQLSDPADIAERWERLARLAGFQQHKVAALLNVSVRTVQRHFRAHYQMPLVDWLRSVRL